MSHSSDVTIGSAALTVRRVFKLQKQIYRASQRGDIRTVHKLQKLLMKSWAAKCLAVRRVTQDN
ncbi:MAG: reverse transcriptase N-terminal domain-containing protein, partial [Coleofasciculus sp. C1-SOL-03]|uniref:reverse transcriptase N-terminal domain-containing protein n=1 Tax=Coleofasciculus sp. C1-SOL-03 TaxID=3069522 RepID=UPI0032FC0197